MSFTEDEGEEAGDVLMEVFMGWLKMCMAPLEL
jgi:hypothetical protein